MTSNPNNQCIGLYFLLIVNEPFLITKICEKVTEYVSLILEYTGSHNTAQNRLKLAANAFHAELSSLK